MAQKTVIICDLCGKESANRDLFPVKAESVLTVIEEKLYWHHHCDSELTVRSKDLGRYTYCEASHVPHLHEPTGHDGQTPEGINDYALQNSRHDLWVSGGRDTAKARLKALET